MKKRNGGRVYRNIFVLFAVFVVVLCVSFFSCGKDGDAADHPALRAPLQGGEFGDALTSAIESEAPKPPAGYVFAEIPNGRIYTGALLLVNFENEYRFTEDDFTVFYKNKPDSYKINGTALSVATEAFGHFNDYMNAFYRETGHIDVLVIEGMRTYEEQRKILDARIAVCGEAEALKYVALPGYSEHHTGLAVDIRYDREEGAYSWINEHMHEYGFILRYPADKEEITKIAYEYWHYRYVGVPHAQIMREGNYCLEEYIELLRGYTVECPFEFETKDGKLYSIYYAAADGEGATVVCVPENKDYVISGNNVDGFVITVTGENEYA